MTLFARESGFIDGRVPLYTHMAALNTSLAHFGQFGALFLSFLPTLPIFGLPFIIMIILIQVGRFWAAVFLF